MSNLVKCTISFASLEKAVSFYGNTKPQGQPLIGTETALVPQLNDGLELSIYHKKQNKWKLPNPLHVVPRKQQRRMNMRK